MERICLSVFFLLAALISCCFSQINGEKWASKKPLRIDQEGIRNSLPKSEIFDTVQGEWKNAADENGRTKVKVMSILTSHREYHDVKFDREDFLKRHTIHQRSNDWKTGPLDRATIQRLENKLYQNYESLRKDGRPPPKITNSTTHIVAILDYVDWKDFNARLDSYEKKINVDNCVAFTYKLNRTFQQYLYSGSNEWTEDYLISKKIVGNNQVAIASRKGPGNNPTVTGFNLPQLQSTRTIAFKPTGSGLELSVAVSDSAVLVPEIVGDVNIKTLTFAHGKFQDLTVGLVLKFKNAGEHFGLKTIDSEKNAEFKAVSDDNRKVILKCPDDNRLACNARETNQGLECFGNSNAKNRRTLRKKKELTKIENQVWKRNQERYEMPSTEGALIAEIMEDLKNGDHIRKTALGLRSNVVVGQMTLYNSIYNMNEREKSKGNSTPGTNAYIRGINVNDAIREKDPEALAVVGAKYFGQPLTQSLLRGGTDFLARALLLLGKSVSGYMGEPDLGVQALREFISQGCSSGEKEGGSSVCEQRDALSDWLEKLERSPSSSSNTLASPQTPSMKLEEIKRVFGFNLTASEDQLLLEAPEGYISIANETKELQLKQFMLGITESELFGLQPRIIASNNLKLLGKMRGFLKNHSETYWGYVRPAYRKFEGLETVRFEAICQRNKKLDFVSLVLLITIVGSPFAAGIQAGKYFSADQCETLKKFENSRSIQNNIVDLGDFGLRHLEQWSPSLTSDSSLKEEDFFCPPANVSGMDGTSSVQAFKCVDALGYKIQEPGPGLTVFIDLEVGDDSARGSQNSPNLFVVDDGRKDYKGGPFSDTFLIQGKPSGVVNGGEGEDVLDLSLDFKSKSILIENGAHVLKTAGKEKLELRSIEVIRGRPDWMDLIYAACNNTYIDGQNGSTAEADRIFLGSGACGRTSGNPGKLQIMVLPRTHVTNLNRDPSTVFTYFVVKSNESYSGWNRKITIEYSNESSENHVQFDMPLEAIGTVALTKKNQNESTLAIRFSILDLEISFDYRNYRHIRMFFGQETEIVLFPTLTTISSPHNPIGLAPVVLFLLDPENKPQVFGAKNNRNFFVFNFMRSSLQNVTGGNLDDVFLFMKPTAVKTLFGGSSPDNTIELDNGLQGLIKFDFVEGNMHSNSNNWYDTIRLVGNFTRVYGRWNESEEVIASCIVKVVDLKFKIPAPELGSALPEDTITIPGLTCPLGHHAEHHIYSSTKVMSEPVEGVFSYWVHRSNHASGMNPSSISVTIPSATCLLSHRFLLLEHRHEDLTEIWFKKNSLQVLAPDIRISVTFLTDIVTCEDGTNLVFVLSRGVSASVLKLPERTVPEVVLQFNLTLNDEATVKGHERASNLFLIRGNTPRNLIEGGKKDNLFIFGDHSPVVLIDAGASGNNYLEITEDLQGRVFIDLHRNKIKWPLGKETEIKGRINMIIGRKGGSESLETGCETRMVNLNGGTLESWDKIVVPHLDCKSEPEKVTFEIHPYTSLTSKGSGTYLYRIVTFSHNSGSGKAAETILDLSESKDGAHFIEFEEKAHEMENWNFDSSSAELKVKVQNFYILVKLPKDGDPFARNHFFVSKDNAKILFKPRNGSDQFQPHVRWNVSNLESGRDSIKGMKEYPNTFFINNPKRMINLVQGGDQNDEFILGPEAWVKAIDGGKGENVLVLQKSSQEISLPQKTIFGPENKISLKGKFTAVRAGLGTSTTVIPNCDTEFVDLTRNFTSSGSSPPGNSSGDDFPSTANLVMIRNLSSCDYDLGIQLAPRLGTLWVLNGADRGRFKYFLPLVDSNITLYHVMRPWKDKASSDRTPERYFHYQFSLPVDLAQVSDIDQKSRNSYMTFELSNGVRSRVEVLSVPSQKGLEELEKYLRSKEGTFEKRGNLTPARTPVNYFLKFFDGSEVLVNHKRIADTMKSAEGTVQTDIRRYIADKCKIPNALGLTLTHQTKSNGKNGVPNKDIQIAGSDETDDLLNSDFHESHLVANAGSSTVFRIRPTTSPVYIYVPVQRETNPFEGSESTHIMDWTAFYPIPAGVQSINYCSDVSIPTVVRDKDDLILKALTTSVAPSDGNQTVIFVDGVLSYKRMLVQLCTSRYEFHEYQNPSPDEKEEWLWGLRITKNIMNDHSEKKPQFKKSFGKKGILIPSRRKRSAVYDPVYEFEDSDSPTDEVDSIKIQDDLPINNQIIVTSYADLVEYHQAGASIPIGAAAASGQGRNDTIFSLGDSLVITNTLQDPTYFELTKRYFGLGEEPTTGRQTILMMDMRADMEEHNFTLSFHPGEDPGTETVAPSEEQNAIVITHLNFTEFRNVTQVAEDIENKKLVFKICMTILIVLLVCLLIFLLLWCCYKYRYHLKWIFFLLKRGMERQASRMRKRSKGSKVNKEPRPKQLQSTSGTALLSSPTSMDLSPEDGESVVGARKGVSQDAALLDVSPQEEDDTTLYKFICRIWNIPVYHPIKDDHEDV